MKKLMAILLAVMTAVLVFCPTVAEETVTDAQETDLTGIWVDPAFDRAQLVILRSEYTWADDRMGEEIGGDRYVIYMEWADSASEQYVYHIVGTMDETGREIHYENGLLTAYAYLDDGSVDEENTSLVEDNGTGSLTLAQDGTLRWDDSFMEQSRDMALRRQVVEAPSADEIKAEYYDKVIALQPGAAGASLNLAQTACELFRFCSIHSFWNMDAAAFAANLLTAQETLTANDQAAFVQNRALLSEEAVRLLDESEALGGEYADAGVEESMIELRGDPAVRLSVETFIFAVETLNEVP